MRTALRSTLTLRTLAAIIAVVPLSGVAFAGDDHGDTCETATIVQFGTPVQGLMGEWPDEDWFAFDAVEGRLYYIDVQWLHDGYGYTGGEMHRPGCGEAFVWFNGESFYQRPDVALIADETGRYAIRLDWARMQPGGPYEVLITDLGPRNDDHADLHDGATQIVIADGSEIHARIDHAMDVDWFRAELPGGMVYSLELRNELLCDQDFMAPQIYLRAERWENQRYIANVWNGPAYWTCEQSFSTRVFAVPESRAGEIAIRAELEWPTGQTAGTYTFLVRPIGPIPLDDHPDTCEGARVLTPAPIPAPVSGVTYTDLDPDWFAFDAVEGRSYEFTLGGGNENGLSYEVYSPGCVTSVGEGSQGWQDGFAFICPESGRYTIRVQQDWESGSIHAYTVSVTDFGDVPDDHGNGHGSATSLLADGNWAYGAIEYAVDQDVFRVAMDENTVYAFEIESLTGCARMYAVMEGEPSGATPAAADESDEPDCERWDDFSSVVWYYVGVGHSGDRFLRVRRIRGPLDEVAAFRVRVYPIWSPKGDEQPGECSDAAVIEADGPSQRGVVTSDDDADAFRFEAQAGHVYRVVTEHAPDWVRANLYFPDPAGLPACDISVREYGAETVYAPRAGWYTLRIAGTRFGDGLPYQVRVTDDGPAIDDHLDTPQLGTWMPTDGTEVAGTINFADDMDAFRVRLFPHNSYRVRLRSISSCGVFYANLTAGYVHLSTPWYDCERNVEERSIYISGYEGGEHSITVTGYGANGTDYAVSIELLSCSADLNTDGRLDSVDFFLFLSRLFNSDEDGDFNSDGRVDSQDLFDYLGIYLTGC